MTQKKIKAERRIVTRKLFKFLSYVQSVCFWTKKRLKKKLIIFLILFLFYLRPYKYSTNTEYELYISEDCWTSGTKGVVGTNDVEVTVHCGNLFELQLFFHKI